MKKVLLTTGAIAVLTGSQMGFAACVSSGNPNATSASCQSDVTLQVDNLVVLKGLDNYDFSDPGDAGWDGTGTGKATRTGDFCVGTNNATNGVSVTVGSTNGGFNVVGGSTGQSVAYTVLSNGVSITDGGTIDLSSVSLEDLGCGTENVNMNVEFTGAALLTANVGENYTDIITVTVAPN